jgi:hypothetical protein
VKELSLLRIEKERSAVSHSRAVEVCMSGAYISNMRCQSVIVARVIKGVGLCGKLKGNRAASGATTMVHSLALARRASVIDNGAPNVPHCATTAASNPRMHKSTTTFSHNYQNTFDQDTNKVLELRNTNHTINRIIAKLWSTHPHIH